MKRRAIPPESGAGPRIRAVLFDIDGTLILTGGAGMRAFASVARHTFGVPDGTGCLPFAGRTDLAIIREFFTRAGIPPSPDNFARFLDDYVFWLDHFLHELPGEVLPGVLDLLRSLRLLPDPPLIGLLTGNIRLGGELKLRRFGLWEEFAMGAFGDDHEDRNRLAAIAHRRAGEWLGRSVEGTEILVVGDTPLDIACARAIGARCLAVATGGATHQSLTDHQPDWVVHSLRGIEAALICGRSET
jgi:phosphoglycolate phosphatase-like HAD superfamily hydrolase